VAVLLNKVVLEYIPKYGQRLADEVRKWGQWVKEEAEKELAEFYPKDEDGSTPIAYLWARTIISEAPDDGTGIPVEVPLMRSLWLAKKAGRNKALRWVRDASGIVQTETLEVTYADGITRKVRRPLLEIFEPKSEKEVEKGTVARGSGTCPVTGFTTPADNVRKQFKGRKGGGDDSRLLSVVLLKSNEQGRFYRLPTDGDYKIIDQAKQELISRIRESKLSLKLVPDEELPYLRSIFNVNLLDVNSWGDLFTSRQLISLIALSSLINRIDIKSCSEKEDGLKVAVQTLLAFSLDKQADLGNSICAWEPIAQCPRHLFGRQAIGIVWDFAEGVVTGDSSGSWVIQIQRMEHILTSIGSDWNIGNIASCSAVSSPLPNDSANSFITDPPYYDAIPYADLSDFFYVWLKRTIGDKYKELFEQVLTPKKGEIVQLAERNPKYSYKTHEYYETLMTQAMSEGRRILASDGVGIVVFAHKSTAGWEAQLQAMINAGWIITGSWAIDTEMGSRLRAMNSAALASSVHLVCRPRSNNEIGDWRNILQELPLRIKEWMPRLTEQGVVGADAIFACLGPALEIFSRYSSVEKASGEIVPLREYLEYVWAAISKEALSTIFKDADTSNFEEDARLTAMWLWTLSAGEASPPAPLPDGEGSDDDDDDENTSKKPKITGFSLEYDTARKIAQGLGAHLENLTHLVEVKGDKARLLPVKERAAYLFGKEGMIPDIPKKKAKGDKQLTLIGVLDELPEDEYGEVKISRIGETICDKVHQAMLLFNSG
ncbi:DUF1156 domain-containing protein, partial [Planktothrix agardhii 1033]|nr:DUF1156 domain-containing protein [Planktothrix agardhii 1033]